MPDYLTLSEAALKADLAPRTLRAQVTNGRLQAEKIGHAWVTTDEWLRAYLESRQHTKSTKEVT